MPILYGDFLRTISRLFLKNLDEILHKSIALSKMNSSDPSFGDCLFELTNLMRAKGDVGIISNIISKAIRIRKDNHSNDHLSNELPSLGVDQSQDDVEHGYMMRMMIVTMILMMQ